MKITSHKLDLGLHAERFPGQREARYFCIQVIADGPACDLSWVDALPREVVEARSLLEREAQILRGVNDGAAVVHEGRAQRPRDDAMLAVGPHAHEEFDVVNRP